MEIIFRLERMEIGKTLSPELALLGSSSSTYDGVNTEETVRATFARFDGEPFEVLDLLLNLEEAKMYMIGHEYKMTL